MGPRPMPPRLHKLCSSRRQYTPALRKNHCMAPKKNAPDLTVGGVHGAGGQAVAYSAASLLALDASDWSA